MRIVQADFAGICRRCKQPFPIGTPVVWPRRKNLQAAHPECEKDAIKDRYKNVGWKITDDEEPMPEDEKAVAPVAATPAPLDMAEVAALIAKEVEKRVRPMTVEIVVKAEEKVKKVSGAHFFLERVIRMIGAGIPVYLWGPAGTGKTTAALQAAEALGRDAEIDTLDPSTFRSMVQGYMTPTGDAVHTAFTRCWTEGKIYVGDEIDNAPGHVQTLFNSALANAMAPLAWSNTAVKAGFGFIGTGNTPGRPTRQFPDRKPMSAAFADRLYFIHWPLDPAIECRAVGLPTPAAPVREAKPCTAQAWVTYVQAMRTWTEANMPTLMVTPRASLTGLKALALGESTQEVAEALIFRGCDAEMQRKAMNAVPLPV